MDLVTLTDHDTIEGALELASLPNTFVSEEVTVKLPGGRDLHVGALDITPQQHERITTLRSDAESLFAYLAEQEVPAVVNHLFSALTGRREPRDIPLALGSGLSLIESRNGMMGKRVNECAHRVGKGAGFGCVGGSDAHTLASVASAYTMVRGARSREDFLQGLRRGWTIPRGEHGSYRKLTADVGRITALTYREGFTSFFGWGSLARIAALLLAVPLLPLVPVVTAWIYTHERFFAERHYRLLVSQGRAGWNPSGPWGTASAPVRL
jgi:hypothetical protein